ncbi:glutamyl-tRNA amidotransferase [Sulfodiicoccus acidiphilus]|uniref:Glutamyl-tRNA(Gln) amidotransferase subunit A n=1 Tax=Sulfodiicoccus acidiphilus TaxID=1670455 RepID=A0A348B369_9CREN|nr:Asp-tRNA(Asn)/Glu-tRNA(Gln) amidotransferase subunit GatA [Sulfodiicoccus acidiphilus]BBD72621.1 glutamyl-tRNA amidotransferase [Sulfodiicoccus acidiphilus]GGT93266.1 glutamyl-tRNA amidotransferase [Sulfodiicoccus acidiphilus]
MSVRELKEGRLSPEEYVYSTYEKIEKIEELNAFTYVEKADVVLKEVKARLAEGRGRLTGLLIAIKDNISVRGMPNTCGSRMLSNYISPYDATVIRKLREEGAVVVGKTNMDEFAMGSTTETSYFGPVRNPLDPERIAGGSSGGSAVAVAADVVKLALGSDTGGSIRAPASFTGIYGLKPSYGTVSRYGLVAYANSLEQIGPFAQNPEDLELLYDVIRGPDPKDSTTISDQPESPAQVDMKGLRVGLLVDVTGASEPPVRSVTETVANKLSDEGASVKEVTLGLTDYLVPAYYIIAMSEASSNLARYDGVRYGYSTGTDGTWKEVYGKTRGEGFGTEVKRRILLGSFILSAGYYEQYYLKALKVRTLVIKQLTSLLKEVNVLLSPTMPILPPKLGEVISDPIRMYMMDVNTVVANLTGAPSLSLPAGKVGKLSVGVQLTGPHLSDFYLIQIARSLREAGIGA